MSINNERNLYSSTLDETGLVHDKRKIIEYNTFKIISDIYKPTVVYGSLMAQTLFRVIINNPRKLDLTVTGKFFSRNINYNDDINIKKLIKVKSNSRELKESLINNRSIKELLYKLSKECKSQLVFLRIVPKNKSTFINIKESEGEIYFAVTEIRKDSELCIDLVKALIDLVTE